MDVQQAGELLLPPLRNEVYITFATEIGHKDSWNLEREQKSDGELLIPFRVLRFDKEISTVIRFGEGERHAHDGNTVAEAMMGLEDDHALGLQIVRQVVLIVRIIVLGV